MVDVGAESEGRRPRVRLTPKYSARISTSRFGAPKRFIITTLSRDVVGGVSCLSQTADAARKHSRFAVRGGETEKHRVRSLLFSFLPQVPSSTREVNFELFRVFRCCRLGYRVLGKCGETGKTVGEDRSTLPPLCASPSIFTFPLRFSSPLPPNKKPDSGLEGGWL